MDISLLSAIGLLKIFSQSVGYCFVLLTVSFALQKLWDFMRSYLSIVDVRALAIGVLFKKFPPVPMSSRLFPTFISFNVSGFMWRSLIHLDYVSFVEGDKNGSIYTLVDADLELNQHHLLEMLDGFSSFVKDQVTIGM
jgi:hypothetical protein